MNCPPPQGKVIYVCEFCFPKNIVVPKLPGLEAEDREKGFQA
jgi:hypothetical protein